MLLVWSFREEGSDKEKRAGGVRGVRASSASGVIPNLACMPDCGVRGSFCRLHHVIISRAAKGECESS